MQPEPNWNEIKVKLGELAKQLQPRVSGLTNGKTIFIDAFYVEDYPPRICFTALLYNFGSVKSVDDVAGEFGLALGRICDELGLKAKSRRTSRGVPLTIDYTLSLPVTRL